MRRPTTPEILRGHQSLGDTQFEHDTSCRGYVVSANAIAGPDGTSAPTNRKHATNGRDAQQNSTDAASSLQTIPTKDGASAYSLLAAAAAA